MVFNHIQRDLLTDKGKDDDKGVGDCDSRDGNKFYMITNTSLPRVNRTQFQNYRNPTILKSQTSLLTFDKTFKRN